MSTIKTPRLAELDKAISEAKEKLESIKQPYDFEAANRKAIDARIDATASSNTMWDKMEKLLALKESYPNSVGWSTINAQNLSDELNRFILVWESFEQGAIRSDENRYKVSLKMAADAIVEAEKQRDSYLASQQYEIDSLKAQMEELTNKRK